MTLSPAVDLHGSFYIAVLSITFFWVKNTNGNSSILLLQVANNYWQSMQKDANHQNIYLFKDAQSSMITELTIPSQFIGANLSVCQPLVS